MIPPACHNVRDRGSSNSPDPRQKRRPLYCSIWTKVYPHCRPAFNILSFSSPFISVSSPPALALAAMDNAQLQEAKYYIFVTQVYFCGMC